MNATGNLNDRAFESDFEVGGLFPSRSHQGSLLKLRFCWNIAKGSPCWLAITASARLICPMCWSRNSICPPTVRETRLSATLTDRHAGLSGHATGAATPGPASIAPSQDQILRSLEARLDVSGSGRETSRFFAGRSPPAPAAAFETLQLLMKCPAARGQSSPADSGGTGRTTLESRAGARPRSRVAVRMAIDPLPPEEETGLYIEHRLQFAGCQGSMFRAEAYQSFWEISQGVPRRLIRSAICLCWSGMPTDCRSFRQSKSKLRQKRFETVSWE